MNDEFDCGNASQQTVSIDQLLASRPLSGFAIAVLCLCIAVAMTEGYDTQAMALVAPMIARSWNLTQQQIGLLLAGSVLGVVAGSFALSPLGDRWGRRPSVLLGLGGAGVGTLLGGLVANLEWLLATRILAGLGLGLAFPNVIALALEYMPARYRTIAVILVNCGYPLGAAVGGMINARLVTEHGFQVIFLVGGIATISVTTVALFALPESPAMLARQGGNQVKLRSILTKLGVLNNGTREVISEGEQISRSPVVELFAPERRTATALLWVTNFANMTMVYYLFTWLPSIVADKGATPQVTLLSVSSFSFGGVLGGIVMGLLMTRVGPTIILSAAYCTTIVGTMVLAGLPSVDEVFLVLLAIVGGVTAGSQFCLVAVVNLFYPSRMRATASGYATGIGRFGAAIAPLAGAVMMSSRTLAPIALAAPAIPALVAMGALLILHSRVHYWQPVPPVGKGDARC